MAYVDLPAPVWIGLRGGPSSSYTEAALAVVDAAGESGAYIGYIHLSSGPGTSKTLQSGDIIHWRNSTTTFANGSTVARVGVQDVDATTGLEDGSWDVYADFTGGGGGIAAGTVSSTLTTGTKTINDGDLLAVVIEFTARGGADVIRPIKINLVSGIPYCTVDSGSGPGKDAAAPAVTIEFADGTIGYFTDESTALAQTGVSFNSGSAPDEVASLFELPVGVRIDGVFVSIGELDSGETGNLNVYADPTGTPSALATVAVDPDLTALPSSTAGRHEFPLGTTLDLSADTLYAVAYEATSAGNRMWGQVTLPSAACRRAWAFGTTLQGGGRVNGSGAFGSLSSTVMLMFGLRVIAIDVGSGSGGGLRLAGRGGLAMGA